jgi:hypothetical protein
VGLWIDDILIGFASHPVATVDDLLRLLTQVPVGVPTKVQTLREGRMIEHTAIPEEYPSAVRGEGRWSNSPESRTPASGSVSPSVV